VTTDKYTLAYSEVNPHGYVLRKDECIVTTIAYVRNGTEVGYIRTKSVLPHDIVVVGVHTTVEASDGSSDQEEA
jgi:hypothetical protein